LLVKVLKVDAAIPTEDEAQKMAKRELNAALVREYLAAYKQSLREKAKVTVNEKILLGNATNN
jgi:peptidyl-prolyl cis-trans isomerase D